MNCEEFEKYLDAYFDGDMSTENAEKIETHAKTCSVCRRLLQDYSEMCRQVRTLGVLACPADVVARVYDRIDEQEMARREHLRSRFRRPFQWQRLRFASVVTAVALLVCLFLPPSPGYDYARIKQADREVKMVLARLNMYTERVEGIIAEEVLGREVAIPLSSSVFEAIQPFLDGEKS